MFRAEDKKGSPIGGQRHSKRINMARVPFAGSSEAGVPGMMSKNGSGK
jgi:hypothetical protein